MVVQFAIGCFVVPWDDPTLPPGLPPGMTFHPVSNIEMGKALLGVIVHPNAKGVSIDAVPDNLEKLAQNGTV